VRIAAGLPAPTAFQHIGKNQPDPVGPAQGPDRAGPGDARSGGPAVQDGHTAAVVTDGGDNADGGLSALRASARAVTGPTSTSTSTSASASASTSASGQLTDADHATEVSSRTQSKIRAQAAASVQAQANSAPQSILKLLQ
jgi:flagellin-like hook-associated protein FlgL